MGKLTVRGIESAKTKSSAYKMMDGDGLQLRVATDGAKTWLVRYSIGGKERQYRLPKAYRDVGGEGFSSLQDAREEAAKIRALARQGVDFQQQLELQLEAEAAQAAAVAAQEVARSEIDKAQNLTVKDLFEAWITDGVRRKDGNAELKRSFGANVLPLIGAIAVRDLTEHHLRGVLRALVDRGVNRTAVMIRNSLTQMFAWGRKRQPWRKLLVEGDPMDLIEIEKIVSPEYDLDNTRDRILSATEIRELRDIFRRMGEDYEALPDKRFGAQPLERKTQLAIWIMLSTLCRVGETTMARWQHVDLAAGTWFIPKANVKDNLADLTVYLSAFAVEQFRQLKEISGHTPWCFPSRNTDQHLDTKAMSKQLGDRQTQFKKSKDGGPRKPMMNRRADNTLVLAGGANGAWTAHDLRRTGATMMQALGVALDIIDRCQNHVLAGSKVRRHYLHHDYPDEKRAAWALLGARLEVILGGAGAGAPTR